MKTKSFLSLGLVATLSHAAWASPVSDSATSVDNIMIPDNDLNGVSETINFSGSGIQSITDVQLSLIVAGGFNGDFYAYLVHGSEISVLLNRVGVTSANIYGYDDSGFNITFANGAANGNIHTYQSVVNPNGGILTGAWQADGRAVSPTSVTDATPVTAGLNVFDGSSGDGDWTLFIADADQGDIGSLVSWNLTVTGDNGQVAAPDTAGTLGLLAFGASLLVAAHRRTFAGAIK